MSPVDTPTGLLCTAVDTRLGPSSGIAAFIPRYSVRHRISGDQLIKVSVRISTRPVPKLHSQYDQFSSSVANSVIVLKSDPDAD
jgi:hypothetical protein